MSEASDKTKTDKECHKQNIGWKCNRNVCKATGASTSVDILPTTQQDCCETVTGLDANGNAIIGTNHRWERS
jgi:hypothetical protein